MSTVTAEWVGPYQAQLADGTTLEPGQRYRIADPAGSAFWANVRTVQDRDDDPISEVPSPSDQPAAVAAATTTTEKSA